MNFEMELPTTYFPDLMNCILADCKKIRHMARVIYQQNLIVSNRSLYKDDDDPVEKELVVVLADAPIAVKQPLTPMKKAHIVLPVKNPNSSL